MSDKSLLTHWRMCPTPLKLGGRLVRVKPRRMPSTVLVKAIDIGWTSFWGKTLPKCKMSGNKLKGFVNLCCEN